MRTQNKYLGLSKALGNVQLLSPERHMLREAHVCNTTLKRGTLAPIAHNA